MNNENSQAQAKSHAGRNDRLGINFAWPNLSHFSTNKTAALLQLLYIARVVIATF